MNKIAVILIGAVLVIMPVNRAQASEAGLTVKDLATADGSCRVGLQQDNNIACVLTAIETRTELTPDSWSNDQEATNWTSWLSDFDNGLYSRWLKSASVNGQETVSVRIADGAVNIVNGTFLQPPASPVGSADDSKSKFEALIRSALEQTLKAAPPMPITKNKLKEIRTTLTFMRDPKVVPRFGKVDFDFAAVRGADGNLVVYGGTINGRSPGIQIISDKDGGSIQVTDQGQFVQRCNEIDKAEGP